MVFGNGGVVQTQTDVRLVIAHSGNWSWMQTDYVHCEVVVVIWGKGLHDEVGMFLVFVLWLNLDQVKHSQASLQTHGGKVVGL